MGSAVQKFPRRKWKEMVGSNFRKKVSPLKRRQLRLKKGK